MVIAFSKHANHAFEIAAGLDLAAFSSIACVGKMPPAPAPLVLHFNHMLAVLSCAGGDGTVHEVTNGLAYAAMLAHDETRERQRVPPLCIVPCGSGNNLALHMGIQSLADAIAAALGGLVQQMDIVAMTRPEDETAPRLEAALDLLPRPLSAAAGGTGAESNGHTGPGARGPASGAAYDETDACLRRCAAAKAAFSDRVMFSVNTIGFGLGVVANKLAVEKLRLFGRAQYTVRPPAGDALQDQRRPVVHATLYGSSTPQTLRACSSLRMCICCTTSRGSASSKSSTRRRGHTPSRVDRSPLRSGTGTP